MTFYRLLADLLVAAHVAYVGFVVVGFLLVLVGILLHWSWIRNFWFRAIHFVMIGVVVAETVFGMECPLTSWENDLRILDKGDALSEGEVLSDDQIDAEATFIGRIARRVLFYDLPDWVLATAYYVFGGLVLAALVLAPPRRPRFPFRFPRNRVV